MGLARLERRVDVLEGEIREVEGIVTRIEEQIEMLVEVNLAHTEPVPGSPSRD